MFPFKQRFLPKQGQERRNFTLNYNISVFSFLLTPFIPNRNGFVPILNLTGNTHIMKLSPEEKKIWMAKFHAEFAAKRYISHAKYKRYDYDPKQLANTIKELRELHPEWCENYLREKARYKVQRDNVAKRSKLFTK